MIGLMSTRNCIVYPCNGRGGFRVPQLRDIRLKWLTAIKWAILPLEPKNTAVVCPTHFTPEDFNEVEEENGSTSRILKPDAIPSVFPWNSDLWSKQDNSENGEASQSDSESSSESEQKYSDTESLSSSSVDENGFSKGDCLNDEIVKPQEHICEAAPVITVNQETPGGVIVPQIQEDAAKRLPVVGIDGIVDAPLPETPEAADLTNKPSERLSVPGTSQSDLEVPVKRRRLDDHVIYECVPSNSSALNRDEKIDVDGYYCEESDASSCVLYEREVEYVDLTKDDCSTPYGSAPASPTSQVSGSEVTYEEALTGSTYSILEDCAGVPVDSAGESVVRVSAIKKRKRRAPGCYQKTAEQKELLERAYQSSKFPSFFDKEVLCWETGLDMRVIEVWYQNRRAKERKAKHEELRKKLSWYRQLMKESTASQPEFEDNLEQTDKNLEPTNSDSVRDEEDADPHEDHNRNTKSHVEPISDGEEVEDVALLNKDPASSDSDCVIIEEPLPLIVIDSDDDGDSSARQSGDKIAANSANVYEINPKNARSAPRRKVGRKGARKVVTNNLRSVEDLPRDCKIVSIEPSNTNTLRIVLSKEKNRLCFPFTVDEPRAGPSGAEEKNEDPTSHEGSSDSRPPARRSPRPGILRNLVPEENSSTYVKLLIDGQPGYGAHCSHLAQRLEDVISKTQNIAERLDPATLVKMYDLVFVKEITHGVIYWGNCEGAHAIFNLQKRFVGLMERPPQERANRSTFINLRILTLPSIYILHCLIHVHRNLDKLKLQPKKLPIYEVQGLEFYEALPTSITKLKMTPFIVELKKFLMRQGLFNPFQYYDSVKNFTVLFTNK